MTNRMIFVLSAASLLVAGSALGATKHDQHRGYNAYGAAYGAQGAYGAAVQGQGYDAACARANAQWSSEPGSMAIQDQDQANAVGGRKGTCH
jgi:hypothetical protein